ncbi:phenylacetaldoxime dehydratase family protein [Rhodococcus pyridinivorans]|uniref:ABM domain-containing protein n=1 Tax=Rhodococcus sp. NS1 TaxID=402236 RepID=A0A097SPQ0_9NOCA|nr:phenylacetaldoxime dehydratase family protein [Rhodococcus pyridinivorans]AIU93499.1 hypothetical protein LRS1606.65 [Rhodococcus sp. NS1]
MFVQLGVQGTDRDAVERQLELWVPLLSNSGHSPKILDRGHFTDNTGLHNSLLLAYWFSPDGYEQWAALPEVDALWRSLPDDGDFGYWRETASITQDRMETIYTPHDPVAYDTPGIAQHVEIGPTPTHDY